MDILQIPIADYAYLEGVSWDEYESLLKQAGERPIRFTYDDGKLEIMTLSFEHARPSEHRLIDWPFGADSTYRSSPAAPRR